MKSPAASHRPRVTQTPNLTVEKEGNLVGQTTRCHSTHTGRGKRSLIVRLVTLLPPRKTCHKELRPWVLAPWSLSRPCRARLEDKDSVRTWDRRAISIKDARLPRLFYQGNSFKWIKRLQQRTIPPMASHASTLRTWIPKWRPSITRWLLRRRNHHLISSCALRMWSSSSILLRNRVEPGSSQANMPRAESICSTFPKWWKPTEP